MPEPETVSAPPLEPGSDSVSLITELINSEMNESNIDQNPGKGSHCFELKSCKVWSSKNKNIYSVCNRQ